MCGAAFRNPVVCFAEVGVWAGAHDWLGQAGLDLVHLLVLPLVGLCAGLVGGMLGVGGGLVMIPALLLSKPFGPDSLHLYKLASLISSVVFLFPAAVRHALAGAVVPWIVTSAVPFGLAGVVLGVLLAGLFQGQHVHVLARLFGAFMILVVGAQVVLLRLQGSGVESWRAECPVAWRWLLYGSIVGLPAGLVAGLLGLGGGVWMVPVLHLYFGMRLRFAIANSTAIIVGLSVVATIAQTAAVVQMPGVDAWAGWWLALWLCPGAVAGGWFGAVLGQRLPLLWLRWVFYLLLAVVGFRLLLGG